MTNWIYWIASCICMPLSAFFFSMGNYAGAYAFGISTVMTMLWSIATGIDKTNEILSEINLRR